MKVSDTHIHVVDSACSGNTVLQTQIKKKNLREKLVFLSGFRNGAGIPSQVNCRIASEIIEWVFQASTQARKSGLARVTFDTPWR